MSRIFKRVCATVYKDVQDFFGGLTAPLYSGPPKKVFDNRNQSDHLVHRLSALRRTQTTLRTSIISPFIEA